MSLIKTIKAQLGLSVTPANNFTLDASADNGTMKLARGNAGATTQDIMTVDAAGKVAFPQNLVPYIVDANGQILTTSGAAFAENINVVGGSGVGGVLAGGRWTPSVAGVYEVSGYVIWAAATAGSGQFIARKNNVNIISRSLGSHSGSQLALSFAGLVSMNGTTDYLSMAVAQDSGGTLNAECHFSAIFLRGL